jgi:hypothetical protein
MSATPQAAELARNRASKAVWMQTPVVCCTTTSAITSGGATEQIVESATVYGRLFKRTFVQTHMGLGGAGNGALITVTETYLEVPVDAPITVHVRIGGRDYEVGARMNLDDHQRLSDLYHIGRMGAQV